MNELVSVAAGRVYDDWEGPDYSEEPRTELYEYIISPDPLPDTLFDEGDGD